MEKINNVRVRPVIQKGDGDKKAKGYKLFTEPYGNIFLLARKKSGKSTVAFEILRRCSSRKTRIVIINPFYYLFNFFFIFVYRMPVQYGGEVNFEQKELTTGKYELNKLTSREGSANVNITTAGGNESTFEIPTRPLNLARSVLRFTYTPVASGANRYNRIFMDCLSMIRTIELRTRSGEFLCNLQHVGNYTKIVWKPETPYAKFITLDNHAGGTGSGAMLQKCGFSDIPIGTTAQKAAINAANDVAALRAAVNGYFRPPPISCRRHDDTSLADSTAGDYSLVEVPYEEARYISGGNANDPSPVISVKLPLGMILGTIFELDKTIGFNEILDMRIVWESTPKTFFSGSDSLSIATNAAAAAVGATVSNLNLFLAVETDPEVVRGIQDRIAGPGLSIMTEYPHAYKTNLGTASQNFVIKFNRAHGERIRRIYTSAFNNAENSNTAYDNDNRDDAKITEYYTTLDGTRLQQFNVDTSDNEDYMILKDKLKGSAILNQNVYHYNWFHVDTWDNSRPLHDKDQNEKSGLSLDVERRWEFVGTTAGNNLNHYTYMIAQRTITVKGIEVMRT